MPTLDDFNPYTAPEAGVSPTDLANDVDEGRGVWRDGKTLVMVKVARLPGRCVKCNAPATYRLKRSLSWHNPWLYVMVFFPGLIFYVIVALIVRKTAKIEVPFCDMHRARRSKGIQLAWLIALAGIGLCFSPAFFTADWIGLLVLAGIVMVISGMIFGSIRSQTVTPQKIDKTHVWLNKVSPLYLAELPPLPTLDDPEPDAKPKLRLDEI